MQSCDYLIVGGGVIGLSVARELRARLPKARLILLEKEAGPGFHASGRNSGVLHAGFYYSADSLKARFTREGNRLLHEYCLDKGIPVNRCGKLVLARNESEAAQLDVLLSRARANGVELTAVDEKEAREIEPRARVFGNRALWSPTTSTLDPLDVLKEMEKELRASGVEFHYQTQFLANRRDHVETTAGKFAAGYVVNCAGLYADKVARAFGFSEGYGILPFKGLYLYSSEPEGSLRTNLYPVPDLQNPFLGVHFTLTAAGKVKIGPTALPALWREQYDWSSRFNLGELTEIAARLGGLFFRAGFAFRRLAAEEVRKASARHMAALASSLATGVDAKHFKVWGKPGIRAQLLNLKQRTLEMDFVVEGDARSYHVLNSVSPAFTCSFPLARHVVEDIQRKRS